MTTREGVSLGKDALKGEMVICKHRIAMARTVGWPALVESWEQTLKEKQHDYSMRGKDTGTAPDRGSEAESVDLW